MPADPYLLRLHEQIASLSKAQFTQRFGCTGFRFEGPYGNCAHFHKGVDFVLPGGEGTGIVSFTSGVVVPTTAKGLGNSLTVQAPNGLRVIVGHMKNPSLLKVGDPVLAGQYIGDMGSTGSSTAAHVHLQIEKPDGTPINPTPYEWNSWARLWYTLFHWAGAGAGYNPGQSIEVPPDPTTPGYNGTTLPLPYDAQGNPVSWEFANNKPDPGTLPDAPPAVPPYDTGTPVSTGTGVAALPPDWSQLSWLTDNGGPLGQAIATTVSNGATSDSTGSCAQALWVLTVAGIGLLFMAVGLYAITKEEPVQTVTKTVIQPVTDTAGTAISVGSKAAALAA